VPGPRQDPEPLPYLRFEGDWNLDLALEVELNGEIVSRANARDLYWSLPQQLAHATVNGASVRTGDLFASGTISGSEPGSEGSLIELTWNGERPLRLADGSARTFLEDGDEVVLHGRAGNVDLGEVRGRVTPSEGAPRPS
jgi:fumarylacetoacetase